VSELLFVLAGVLSLVPALFLACVYMRENGRRAALYRKLWQDAERDIGELVAINRESFRFLEEASPLTGIRKVDTFVQQRSQMDA
jgi:hypothetical protein